MKAIQWIIAVAALTFVQPAQAAQTDPEVIIYRFPGVFDDGGVNNAGVATSFHCTNFSGVPENIRFVTRSVSGALLTNIAVPIAHLATLTASTHQTVLYDNELNALLATGQVRQGTTAIAATTTSIICTAVTIDAASASPVGLALRGVRFSPIPGSQE
jgi:hypothetical protein